MNESLLFSTRAIVFLTCFTWNKMTSLNLNKLYNDSWTTAVWLIWCLVMQSKNKTKRSFFCLLTVYSKEKMKYVIYSANLHAAAERNLQFNFHWTFKWWGIRDNLLGVRQAYKAGFACITFPWCPFHRGITWPVTPELVASAAWDEIAHWTGGVYRSLAFSIHSPGRKKQPPHASEAEWGGRE